jgi:hypothetical protein
VSTAACTECGSVRTRRVRGGILQHVLAFVLRQDVLMCDRCGRRARLPKVHDRQGREWQRHRTGATTPKAIDLAALDQALDGAPPVKDRR